MRIIAAITSPHQDDVIERVLKHLKIWAPPWKRAVTSPVLPELVTEDLKKPLPANLLQDPGASPIWFESVVARP